MICPIDSTPLVMAERSGVEIDYCPSCRGVWLDRGELDKIIERAPQQPSQSVHPGSQTTHSDSTDRARKPKKPFSLLGEIFDF